MDNESELFRKVLLALMAFFESDSDLLARESSERSITHKLAEHLQKYFPEFKVDCEYNRHGTEVKRLRNPSRESTRADTLDAQTVFPDIVVHERGNDRKNLLVIEAKKSNSRQPHERDYNKLKEFTGQQFRYGTGLFLVLDVQEMRVSNVQCFKDGNEVAIGIWAKLKELRHGG